MSGSLTASDGEGLRDLAARSARAARTAESARAETADPELAGLLAQMAAMLHATASLAARIAERVDPP